MTSRELYRRFMALCKKWPPDDTKLGRDYGQYMRQQFGQHFPMGDMSPIKNPSELDKQLSALERLANNNYFDEKHDLRKSSASGIGMEECRKIVSTEGLLELQKEEEMTILDRLRDSLNMNWLSKSKEVTEQEVKDKTQQEKK